MAPVSVPGSGTSSANVSSRASPSVASSMHQSNQSRQKLDKIGANGCQPASPLLPLSSMTSAPLDLSSVERRGQPTASKEPVTKKTRPHDLQEAPTYWPSEEEWKDPFEYMRKISPEARQYGICKIVPPASWNPDFAIDTEKFHFRTRKQELNSVEGSTRANLNYMDGLAKFHKQHGNAALTRWPHVDKKPLDLYRLKKAVEVRGGLEKVCKLKKWAEIGRDLGYSGKIMSSLSTSLKNSYQKWLWPYEEYLRTAKPGVYQQLELEYGGPLTPSPAPSPMKRSAVNTPSSPNGNSPAQHASDLLQVQVNGHSDRDTPMTDALPLPPLTRSFTPVNSGGFTPLNSVFSSFIRPMAPADVKTSTPTKLTCTPFSSRDTPELKAAVIGTSILKRQSSVESLDSKRDNAAEGEESDTLNRRSKRLKKDSVPTVAGSHMSLLRPSAPSIPRPAPGNESSSGPGETCEQCGKGSDQGTFLLLCESCDHAYHGACLDPPVKFKPEAEWNCPRCLVGDGQFGFEDGGLYSLKQFQEKAANFKQTYFENKMPFDPVLQCHRPVTEDDVEHEFWKLVADLEDTVEVEYGADIHCTTHGSGFPTIEKNPMNPYSTDPWNLNLLPYHPESLFRYIKSDVSGMTVPWVYVGMIFSTFCWHAEDHWTYSANYQHFGATKTWYGIPGDDAEKFETAMRAAVPELFETQPDLLFQLVTLLTPEQLKKAGVRVYALDQRAGQLVITFPQAYHAGFNHGFNFNEAVNFAPCDWEPYGLAGVERLQLFRRQSCFSHDELLWTAAEGTTNGGLTIQNAKWLAPALDKIHRRELLQRQRFVLKHLETPHQCPLNKDETDMCPMEFKVDDRDVLEEEYSCVFCKAYTYLSRFKCVKTGRVLCLSHAGHYACCEDTEAQRYGGKDHMLLYRKDAATMAALTQKVADKASQPQAWEAKYDKLLDDEATPSLKAMRALVAEGEKIPFELPSLPVLRHFVERCNHWVEEATNYTVRKQQMRRKSDRPWQAGARKLAGNAALDQRDRDLRSVDNLFRLLREADQLGFECPEIGQLQERADAIKAFQESAQRVLVDRRALPVEQVEELLEEGQVFNVDLSEVDKLGRLLERLRWGEKAKGCRKTLMTLHEVQQLIEEGQRLSIVAYDDNFAFFAEQLSQGQLWERKAKELIQSVMVNYSQLQALAEQVQHHNWPVTPETMATVDQLLVRQREALRQISDLNKRSSDADHRKRPKYAEVAEIMKKIEELQAKPTGTLDLEKQQKRHEDWMRKGKKLFGKTNAPLHILKSHMEYVLDRNIDCFNTTEDKVRLPAEPASRDVTPDDGGKNKGFEKPREVFCICRKVEGGLMIECELCHEWYHGKCLKIARGKVKVEDKYTCPICDWRLRIPRDAARPKLEDLIAWHDEIPYLPFQPDEEDILKKIIDNAQAFRDFVAPYCNPVLSNPSEIDTQRFFLRKIEGAEILLVHETNFFRRELHFSSPVAHEPPPPLEQSMSTRKPRPTKLQKLLQQHKVSDPDELPEEVRGKANSLKRKDLNHKAAAVAAQISAHKGHSPYAPPPFFAQSQPHTPALSIHTDASHGHVMPGPDSAASTISMSSQNYGAFAHGPDARRANGLIHPSLLADGTGPNLVEDECSLDLNSLPEDPKEALKILSRSLAGQKKAEELFGDTVWNHHPPDSFEGNKHQGHTHQSRPNNIMDHDPLGIGLDAGEDVRGGDVECMFVDLTNQDDDDEAKRCGPSSAAAAMDAHAHSDPKAESLELVHGE